MDLRFENNDCVSDSEEGEKKGDAPARWIPYWQNHSHITLTQAEHHGTNIINNQVYGHSGTKFLHIKGLEKVPRNLPMDCYAKVWWDGLRTFEQVTVSKVLVFGLEDLAHGLDQIMSKNTAIPTRPSNTSAPAKNRGRSPNNPRAPVPPEEFVLCAFRRQRGKIRSNQHSSDGLLGCIPRMYTQTFWGHISFDGV
ncbi:hypothetical protein VP01_1375g6 [Puccinia sorghi]|uniref:Uncharacterized protein n=1 Tax=Puccinia sorghi TaxID=27349 RepID=A0A0L6VM39_9BASI|nr:hypothetical protein VP01_1375g6 [Puccinia sorghi]